MTNLQATIEQAWENRALLQEETTQKAIREVIELLDSGKLRVAEPVENGWQVNEWVKKAIAVSDGIVVSPKAIICISSVTAIPVLLIP